jgi:hypothetical protein
MKLGASIWTKRNGFSIYPINTVAGAIVFLDNWPSEERRPLYWTAADAIQSVRNGQISPDEVRVALVAFLHDAGALAEETLIG